MTLDLSPRTEPLSCAIDGGGMVAGAERRARFTFYLGTHKAHHLAIAGVPLFVSRRTLAPMKKLPRAAAPWALDSGGFTELSLHGRWTLGPREYVGLVRRFRDEIGNLAFAAPGDWMCEHEMVKRTGLSVPEHQRLTTENLVVLRSLAPELPIIPVLQGWTNGDYFDHVEAYARAGVDLTKEPLVGVGTVCRRQATISTSMLLTSLAYDGLKLHGFGLKKDGLRFSAGNLASADSMAWSFHARKRPPMDGHEGRHINCANCLEYALEWRGELLESLRRDSRGQAALQSPHVGATQ